ncbi:transglutaminaseTgpA domain-containing protein [Rheinheimera pleomorphica]|uniref:transglutaminase family protein n=1 Tax=Rheinheimera pleomorphica TaxID=2703963 RepID=UPI00141E9B29|nr:DUF3488 and transglutaminase-like domain-containing protein [Rheinheimera pleomorphica]
MLKQKPLLMLWLAIQLSLLILLQQAFTSWISATFAALLLLRLLTTWRAKETLSLKWVNVLAAVLTLALLLNLKQAGVLHFMLQILLLAAILRLLALQQLYEARQLVWVHYFLLASCFILHQDMLLAAFIMLVLMGNLYSHFLLFSPAGIHLKWQRVSRAALIILPLWLAMFMLFPRLAPFWQIPTANVASTGLSDTLDPGSIEQLVQDNSLAFRVEFSADIPARSQWYWRARLYEDFDGRRWQVNPLRSRSGKDGSVTERSPGSATAQYRVIAEASQQRHLFALATPVSSSNNVAIAASGLVKAVKPVTQRTSYQISSVLQPVKQQSDEELTINLTLPEGNEQTRAFGRQLGQQFQQTSALVAAITAHFQQQPYFYSLTPPPLGANSVDQFLFNTRTGFCSHYASAAAVILRAAGVPARVVGGYQGGDWHQQQGYLAVRQREAHAWVEYLDNGKWQLFDPTAAVAPERILSSLDAVLSAEQRQLLNPGWRKFALLQTLSLQLMHLDYYWSVWVLGFDDNNQRQLWHQLKQQLTRYAYPLLAVISLLLCAAAWYLLRPGAVTAQPEASRLLQQALAGMVKQKPAQQSLSACLRHYASQHPTDRNWLQQLTDSYEQAVFNNDAAALRLLKQQLKRHRADLRRLQRRV